MPIADQQTLSRLGYLRHRLAKAEGTAPLSLYAICHRCPQDTMLLVLAYDSEDALAAIEEIGLEGWRLDNTVTRRIQRRVDGDRGVIGGWPIRGPIDSHRGQRMKAR